MSWIWNLAQFFAKLKSVRYSQLTFICFMSAIETLEKKCEICSKLTLKTPEQLHWRRSGVLIANNEHISHLFLAFLLLNLNKKMLTRFVLLLFSIKEQISIRFSPTGNNRFIKKNLYGPFLWVGFNCLKATEALRAGSLLFTTTFVLFLLLFY